MKVEVEDITWSTAEDRRKIAAWERANKPPWRTLDMEEPPSRVGWRLTVTPSWLWSLLGARPFTIRVAIAGEDGRTLVNIETRRPAGNRWLKYIERRPVKAAELRAGELEVERLLSE